MLRLPLLLALSPFLLLPRSSLATTYVIQPDGTGDFPTIQAAIDAAVDGDEIVLADGVYRGSGNRNLNFLGKGITVRSMSRDPATCTIDSEWVWEDCEQRGALFVSGEGIDTVLEGVTIMRCDDGPIDVGNCRDGGAAILIEDSSPTLRSVVVTDVSGKADVVRTANSSARIENCSIVACSGTSLSLSSGVTITGSVIAANSIGTSHGVAVSGRDVTLDSCRILGNGHWNNGINLSGGGVGLSGNSVLRDCVITGNRTVGAGGGVYVSGSSTVSIERCTIAGNRASLEAGGIWVGPSSTVTMTSSILWGNCDANGDAQAFLSPGSTLIPLCSDVDSAGVTGPGQLVWSADDLVVDPMYCAPLGCEAAADSGGIYSLRRNSPLLDVIGCGVIGGLGEGCDVAVVPQSWGRIKAAYR